VSERGEIGERKGRERGTERGEKKLREGGERGQRELARGGYCKVILCSFDCCVLNPRGCHWNAAKKEERRP